MHLLFYNSVVTELYLGTVWNNKTCQVGHFPRVQPAYLIKTWQAHRLPGIHALYAGFVAFPECS